MTALEADFYERAVLEVARDLIGCTVVHGATSGVIVETEAYHQAEPASHSFVGLTPRTSTLFGEPGRAYMYLSYGIHAMLNAVCEPVGVGAAVLIRALAPRSGLELMRVRRSAAARRSPGAATLRDRDLCSGPGRLTQALGIGLEANGSSLIEGPVRILASEQAAPPILASEGPAPRILAGPRIGITKATELPWRFCAEGDQNVSRPWPRGGRLPRGDAHRDTARV
ncbi:MAG: DNA-3-methyladenine glycosylase [Solirubrobacteraceae bacterium]